MFRGAIRRMIYRKQYSNNIIISLGTSWRVRARIGKLNAPVYNDNNKHMTETRKT